MLIELLKECKIDRVSNSVAAGQTEVDTTVLDMSGFDGVLFIAFLGTVTDASVLTLTAKENTANSTSSPAPTAISGGATAAVTASGNSNAVLVVDVIRPKNQFVFAALTRTTQNAVVDAIVAIRYRARSVPVSVAGLLASALSSPEA